MIVRLFFQNPFLLEIHSEMFTDEIIECLIFASKEPRGIEGLGET